MKTTVGSRNSPQCRGARVWNGDKTEIGKESLCSCAFPKNPKGGERQSSSRAISLPVLSLVLGGWGHSDAPAQVPNLRVCPGLPAEPREGNVPRGMRAGLWGDVEGLKSNSL